MGTALSLNVNAYGCIHPVHSSMNSKQPAAPSRQSQPIIALIDELPLRRTSTVDFLRSSMTNTAKSFASVAEFAAWMASATPEIGCVIANVGGSSLEGSLATELL